MHRATQRTRTTPLVLAALPAALLIGCGGSSDASLPQLAAATPATLQSCSLSAPIEF